MQQTVFSALTGETVYSLLARRFILRGIHRSPYKFIEETTGKRGFNPLSGLPPNCETLAASLEYPFNTHNFIENHTEWPLYRPFMHPNKRDSVFESLYIGGSPKSRLGILKSNLPAANQLAFCSECADESIDRFGFSHWKREHCNVAIDCCYRHEIPLRIIDLSALPNRSLHLLLPKRDIQSRVSLYSSKVEEKLLFIAEQYTSVLNAKLNVFISSDVYQHMLREEGLTTSRGRVRQREVTQAVKEWLSDLSDLPIYSRLLSALSVERNWVANLVTQSTNLHHPIKNLILWGAFCFQLNDILSTIHGGCYTQLDLDLMNRKSAEPSDDALLLAYSETSSVTQLSKKLGLDINTVMRKLELLEKKIARRPKKVNSLLRSRIIEDLSSGNRVSVVAKKYHLSQSTIYRIKGGLCI